MAITKIHPIKATLNYAIDYITDAHKTDEKVLIDAFDCLPSSAAVQFFRTREDAHARGNVLARHLIQSFLPGETTPEQAQEIGLSLCANVLKDEYEYVLAMYVDKGHLHNHIIFNNVNKETGKCYQSNKRSYHRIRTISDNLCKENHLSVIDEYYEAYRRKYKTNGKAGLNSNKPNRESPGKVVCNSTLTGRSKHPNAGMILCPGWRSRNMKSSRESTLPFAIRIKNASPVPRQSAKIIRKSG